METNLARRAFLKSAPVALASAAVPAVPAIAASVASAVPMAATPALVEAYGRLMAALAEQQEAKDALEWLADEWRHLWPLAPEELLGGANGHIGYGQNSGERDLIGRFIHRDTSDLTKRFNAKQRRQMPRACFSIDTAERLQRRLAELEKEKPTGRNEKALAANTAWREQSIQSLRRKVALARQYEAETERLRQAAGVSKARDRIQDAEHQVSAICADISKIPAANLSDLAIKGEAITKDGLMQSVRNHNGILGEMARFIEEAVKMNGGATS